MYRTHVPEVSSDHKTSVKGTLVLALSFAVGFAAACALGTHLRPQPQDQFAASVAHAHIARPVPAAVARRDLSLRASRPDAPQPSMNRRAALVAGTGAAVTAAAGDRQALARITGISKPELVPQEPGVKVIDIPEVMSGANRADLDKIIEDIDRIYGVHLKVLVARFPDTPGEAIFKYWDNSDGREFGGKTDLNSIIMFVDDKETTGGNSLKFDVGDNVNLLAPNGRWFTSLKAKYGTKKAVNEYGAGGAIVECARAILDGLTNTDEVGAGMFY